MINNKTVIIIGAGASQEVGLPFGDKLKDKIADLLDIKFSQGVHKLSGDDCILSALRFHVGRHEPINNYFEAGRHIGNAISQVRSIDEFVNMHKGNKEIEICSKLAIARSILDAERNSRLWFDSARERQPNLKKMKSTWHNAFLRLITEDCRVNDLAGRLDSITLIVFNYDRCIEHFLYHSFQNVFGIGSNQAEELVQGMKIYHPYGVVGQLPWQRGEQTIEFGAEPNPQQLLSLVGHIKTFTEGANPKSSEILTIRQRISEAGILVFLGFAFHRLNMQLISPESDGRSKTDCYATALDESESNRDVIDGDIRRFCKKGFRKLYVDDLSCAQIFEKYWRNLALF